MQPLIALENGKPIIVINHFSSLPPIGARNLRGAPLPIHLPDLTDDNAVEFLRAIQGYFEQAEKGTLAKGLQSKRVSRKADGITSLRGTTFGDV